MDFEEQIATCSRRDNVGSLIISAACGARCVHNRYKCYVSMGVLYQFWGGYRVDRTEKVIFVRGHATIIIRPQIGQCNDKYNN